MLRPVVVFVECGRHHTDVDHLPEEGGLYQYYLNTMIGLEVRVEPCRFLKGEEGQRRISLSVR